MHRQIGFFYTMRRSIWLVLLLLIVAFGLRVFGIDAVRHDFDRAYAHGAGIGIVDAIADGRWQDLPLLSLRSNINLPNPVLASYIWAAIATFPAGRDPYVITFANIALNVLAMAMLFDLGRRLFGRRAGMVALALAASSLWSVYLAQGAWLQGLLEFSAVASLWLFVRALLSQKPSHLLAALCFTALAMQTYLLAFGLLAQLMVLGGLNWRSRLQTPALQSAFLAGLGLCVAGICLYAGLVYRDNPTIFDLRGGVNNANNGSQAVPNPFGVSTTFAALYHASGVATGRFYEAMWANAPNTAFMLRNTLSTIRAFAIELLLAYGVVLALWRRRFGDWVVLAWFFVPVIGVTVLALLLPNLAVFHHYMIITAPAGYLLAALPLGVKTSATAHIRGMLTASQIKYAYFLPVFTTAALLLIPVANFAVHIGINRAEPFDGNDLETLTIQHLRTVAQTWRTDGCDEIANPQHPNWVTSVNGSSTHIRPATFARHNLPNRGNANTWHVPATGASCVTHAIDAISASTAMSHPINDIGLSTYRQQPQQLLRPNSPECDNTPLAINLGWTQLQQCSPLEAKAGQTVTVHFMWQIGGLPPPHTGYAKWRYEPFIKLIGPQGQGVLNAEGVGVLGEYWRAGDGIISEVNFDLPANLPPGRYRLEFSLFDRGQGRNAWWLKPDQINGPPINALGRDFVVNR